MFFLSKSLSHLWPDKEECRSLEVLGHCCLERQKTKVTVQDAFATALGHRSFLGWGAYGGLGASEFLRLKVHGTINCVNGSLRLNPHRLCGHTGQKRQVKIPNR